VEFAGGIVCQASDFNHRLQLVLRSGSLALATIGLNGLLDKGIQEFVESVLTIPANDELMTPLSELTPMVFFAQSFFHRVSSLDLIIVLYI
jgi:hypothetical protein